MKARDVCTMASGQAEDLSFYYLWDEAQQLNRWVLWCWEQGHSPENCGSGIDVG